MNIIPSYRASPNPEVIILTPGMLSNPIGHPLTLGTSSNPAEHPPAPRHLYVPECCVQVGTRGQKGRGKQDSPGPGMRCPSPCSGRAAHSRPPLCVPLCPAIRASRLLSGSREGGRNGGVGGWGGSRKGLGGRKWRETIAAFVQWGWWRGPWGHAMGAIPQRIAQRAPGLWWP